MTEGMREPFQATAGEQSVRTVAPTSPWTRNVLCGLIATGLWGVGANLYLMTVLPNFILLVGGSNFSVGFAEGLQGIATMVSALPAGYVADKLSRKACIRLGAILQLVVTVALAAAVGIAEAGNQAAFALICVALSVSGITDGIMGGPLVALMDDSCPAGRRSDVETANAVVYGVASAVGPILGLIVFAVQGNDWSLPSMKVVIIIGLLLGQLSIVPCWLMDDKYALGEESEAVHLQTEAANDGEQGGESADNVVSRLNEQTRCGGLVKTKHVRAILFAGELLMCFGAGMTVKFFPVFFDKECHIKPIAVQAMFAALSGCTVLGTLLANKAAWRFGRMEVIVPAYSVGIACTVLLGLMKPWYAIPWVMLPIFMLRCTAMWSNSALLGSVIADYTPKSSRGRWKALGSIIQAGWSGSAAIGGFLIDHYGYGSTFVVTGCFQAFCIPLWLLVFPLIAKETDLLDAAAGSSAPAPTSAQGTPTTGKSPATTRNTPKRSAAVCQALASASPKLNSLYGSSHDSSSKRPSEQKGSAVAPGP